MFIFEFFPFQITMDSTYLFDFEIDGLNFCKYSIEVLYTSWLCVCAQQGCKIYKETRTLKKRPINIPNALKEI